MDILEKLVDLHAQATKERSHYYTGAVIKQAMEEISILRLKLRNEFCGPRLDPSKCSGCNGTGMKDCICGGRGTVEAERDGYKVAALERILREARKAT